MVDPFNFHISEKKSRKSQQMKRKCLVAECGTVVTVEVQGEGRRCLGAGQSAGVVEDVLGE